MKLLSWTNGKKTYLTVAVGIVVGGLQAYGVQIPGWADIILGFAGLGFHTLGTRTAISAQSEATTEQIKLLISAILNQVEVPPSEEAATDKLNAAQLSK